VPALPLAPRAPQARLVTTLRARENALHWAFVTALTLAVAAAFYVPALRATRGDWPAPLDDVFIHFDFARSTARGHPFEWIAGQGYSSGETSVLYPFVLAAGYGAGFRGLGLGVWAAIVACASLVTVMRSLRTLVQPAPAWVPFAAAVPLVSVGVLDWSWFSGMEVALFGAALLRLLVAVKRAREVSPTARRAAAWRAGAWGATLVLLRPEAVVVVAPLAVLVARGAGAQPAWRALLRTGAPAALASAAVLMANFYLTGDAQSAGARLKLLSANPYLSDVDRARELVMNLVYVDLKVLETYLTASPRMWPLLPSLAVAALFTRRTRGLAAACLSGALMWTLLVSWNGAARFQNFRYYMPALALVLVASALGLAGLSRSRAGRALGLAVLAAGVALAAARVPPQIALFRDASANIHDQQVEVGRRLARRMAVGARVLVGDAGAIPYLADRGAIDALGLGGYRRMPFVEAATHGEAAMLELVERLPPGERPDLLALYPGWFARTTALFGTEIDHVTITNNVICGGVTKRIYAADWSAMASADEASDVDRTAPGRDVLDVGDVVSERAHAYVSPAPDGGWTVAEIRLDDAHAHAPLFDAGRIVPDGRCERFAMATDVAAPATLTVRTDADARASVLVSHVAGGEEPSDLVGEVDPRAGGEWRLGRAALRSGAARGDVVSICARGAPLRDFHVRVVADRLAGARPDPVPRR
jgi:hypothetical protein